jgi:hypothetical protein
MYRYEDKFSEMITEEVIERCLLELLRESKQYRRARRHDCDLSIRVADVLEKCPKPNVKRLIETYVDSIRLTTAMEFEKIYLTGVRTGIALIKFAYGIK